MQNEKLFFDDIEKIKWNEKQFSEIIEKIDLNKFKELFKDANESQLKYYQSVVDKDENCFDLYKDISNKFMVLNETFKNSLSEKELKRLLSFTKYFQVQIEKILFMKPRKTKNIAHIDIVNGFYGWTSLCEENVSMASDNFELFLEDLNKYLRRIKENDLI